MSTVSENCSTVLLSTLSSTWAVCSDNTGITSRCRKYLQVFKHLKSLNLTGTSVKVFFSRLLVSLIIGNCYNLLYFHCCLCMVFTHDSVYAIARPSVRLSVTRVDHTKTVEDRIMKLTPSGSSMILVFWRQISSPNFKGFPPNGGFKEGWGKKIQRFSSFKREYLENGSRYGQSYY